MDAVTREFVQLRQAMVGFCLNANVPEDRVDDVLQDCFLRIWNGLHTYDPIKGDLGPWIMGCLRHSIKDYRRAEARQKFDQLIQDYPESPLATDAKKISDALAASAQ